MTARSDPLLPGMRTAAGLILAHGTFCFGDLVIKHTAIFLSPPNQEWYSCHLLTKECALNTNKPNNVTAPKRSKLQKNKSKYHADLCSS